MMWSTGIQESCVAEPEPEPESLAPPKPPVVEAERKLIYWSIVSSKKTAEIVAQLEQFAPRCLATSSA